jgi:hypothetical protein
VITLPEKVRRTLEKVVKEMRVKENVYGIGLFGSRSRGDAVSSSDVDLLILDKAKLSDEYVERIEACGINIEGKNKWLTLIQNARQNYEVTQSLVSHITHRTRTATRGNIRKALASYQGLDVLNLFR